jgi:hypothetical protein
MVKGADGIKLITGTIGQSVVSAQVLVANPGDYLSETNIIKVKFYVYSSKTFIGYYNFLKLGVNSD